MGSPLGFKLEYYADKLKVTTQLKTFSIKCLNSDSGCIVVIICDFYIYLSLRSSFLRANKNTLYLKRYFPNYSGDSSSAHDTP